MIPCLQLLATFRDLTEPNKAVDEAAKLLEDLLIKEIIMPFRSHYLGQDIRENNQVGDFSTSLNDELVSAFKVHRFLRPTEKNWSQKSVYDVKRGATKTKMHLMVSMMSLLFSLALYSCRNTSSQTRREKPWLEHFFKQLTESGSILLNHVSPNHTRKQLSRLHKWMLQQSIEGKLGLSVSILGYVLEQASGLFSDKDTHVDWEIISLCISLDANVFTMPFPSVSRENDYAYKTPNKHLSSLLTKITKQSLEILPEEDLDYDLKLSGIIMPLCDAFSEARDMTGFLGHWQEQLDGIQGRREKNDADGPHGICIWEDETLSKHANRLVEHSLTAGQIDRLLRLAGDDLTRSLDETADSNVRLASIAIIDCIVAAAVQGETLSKLSKTLQLISASIGNLLVDSASKSSKHRWRLWKIQANITDRQKWSSDYAALELQAPAIRNAIELITQVPEWGKSDSKLGLTEPLYVFRYLLAFAPESEPIQNDLQSSWLQEMSTAIEKLLDVMEPFCSRIRHDFFETVKADNESPGLQDSSTIIRDIDSLYLRCMSYLLFKPGVLG